MPYAAQIRFQGTNEGIKTVTFDTKREAEDYVIKRYPNHDTRVLKLEADEPWPEKW